MQIILSEEEKKLYKEDKIKALIDSDCVIKQDVKCVKIPQGVRAILKDTFFMCNMEEVILPDGIEELGARAFENCQNLKSINIPKSVTCIDDQCFMHCKSLNKIYLHSNIKIIGAKAFFTSGEIDIYFDGTENQWANVFVVDREEFNKNLSVIVRKNTIIHFYLRGDNGEYISSDFYKEYSLYVDNVDFEVYKRRKVEYFIEKYWHEYYHIKPIDFIKIRLNSFDKQYSNYLVLDVDRTNQFEKKPYEYARFLIIYQEKLFLFTIDDDPKYIVPIDVLDDENKEEVISYLNFIKENRIYFQNLWKGKMTIKEFYDRLKENDKNSILYNEENDKNLILCNEEENEDLPF